MKKWKDVINMFNILIVDDEREIVELIEVYLKNEGYNVHKCYNGKDALEMIEKEKFHLIILDIMMPDIDGINVCMKIRQKYNIPIIMASAKGQDIDKIQGLSTGADDYIVKPFNMMELMARVKSQIRRYVYLNDNMNFKQDSSSDDDLVTIKDIKIDRKRHQVILSENEVKLTPTEYDILLLLASNRGRVFSSEDIYKEIWKEKYFEGNNTVTAHMWRLREKIEYNPKEPEIIKTVWGVGYKIEE